MFYAKNVVILVSIFGAIVVREEQLVSSLGSCSRGCKFKSYL